MRGETSARHPFSWQESRALCWGLVTLLAVYHFVLLENLSSNMAIDLDTVNFVYAMERFDIRHLAPHPPGYLPYVLLLRLLHLLMGGDSLHVVHLASRLFSSGTVLVMPLVTAQLVGQRRGAQLFTALLAAFHPFLIFHGADGQTHASEGFFSALLLLWLLRSRPPASRFRESLPIGMLLAAGMAMRPSFLLMAAGPILWTYRKNLHALLAIGGVSAVVTVLWLAPTIHLSGGAVTWWQAHQTFVVDGFTDPGENLLGTLRRTLLWVGLLFAPVLPAMFTLSRAPKGLNELTLAACLPSIFFFLLTFVSEPGYFMGLVPLAISWTVLLVYNSRKSTIMGAAALAVEVAILLLPEGGRIDFKTPSIPEIVNRQVISSATLEEIEGPLEPHQSILYITDYPGSPFLRQLPQMRPNTHVLWLHFALDGSHEIASLSHSTAHDLVPIPGPVLWAAAPEGHYDTRATYDAIVLDPLLTDLTRRRLALQTRCPVPAATEQGTVAVLSARCFPEGSLRFGSYTVFFHPAGGCRARRSAETQQ